MIKPKIYSIYQLNRYIKSIFDDDALLSGFFTEAEISNFKEHSSGHWFFTLKDEKSSINAVMFRNYSEEASFIPENGMKVIVFGKISVYEKTGQYQIYAEMIEPSGTGGLHAAFSLLKAKLEADGLFDEARKRPIPAWPGCVAVITSPDGAALRDIITVARRRNSGIGIVVVPVLVQGESAPDEITNAIRAVNIWGVADVIIVGRGGGSAEDLWAFNDEKVARAVFASKIPVVSAVGHETDYTIIDYAADLRAPTPSAAAELCVPDLNIAFSKFYAMKRALDGAVFEKLKGLKDDLAVLMSSIQDHNRILAARKSAVEAVVRRISREIEFKLDQTKTKGARLVTELELLSPLEILKRGYALLYINGKAEKSALGAASQARAGDFMSVRLADGTVNGKIEGVEVFGVAEEIGNDAGTGV